MEKHTMIYLLHSLVIAPALFYLAYASLNNVKLPDSLWRLIMVISLVVGLYHGYEAVRFHMLSKDL